jgi:maltose/moltooligosaccharide transporter
MAAGFTWILDAGTTAMEPYRAFIADKLDDKQMPLGFKCKVFYWFRNNIG